MFLLLYTSSWYKATMSPEVHWMSCGGPLAQIQKVLTAHCVAFTLAGSVAEAKLAAESDHCSKGIAGHQAVAAALFHTQPEHSHSPAGGMPPYAFVVPFLRSSDVPFAHTLVPRGPAVSL